LPSGGTLADLVDFVLEIVVEVALGLLSDAFGEKPYVK
jgi:hypothetical protein